jgi:hypothetical protein
MKLPSFLQPEKWLLVKTFTESVESISRVTKLSVLSGTVFIHLYESNKGCRRIDYATTLPSLVDDRLKDYVYSSELYNTQIVGWLSGRRHPTIPTYNSIPEEDTVNALKGKLGG